MQLNHNKIGRKNDFAFKLIAKSKVRVLLLPLKSEKRHMISLLYFYSSFGYLSITKRLLLLLFRSRNSHNYFLGRPTKKVSKRTYTKNKARKVKNDIFICSNREKSNFVDFGCTNIILYD